MTPGLLVRGEIVQVAGLDIVPPHLPPGNGPQWAYLAGGDYAIRKTRWIRQVIVHTTGGIWPQVIRPGSGPGGECRRYADIWATDPRHSAAHVVVDSTGLVACLADLGYVSAYHAEGSNDWSMGIEMVQGHDGTIWQATIEATAHLIEALCRIFGIPFQYHFPYHAAPMRRMERVDSGRRVQLGGPDCVGVFGHRDNTIARGRGDPGDAIFSAIEARGAEGIDYESGQDLSVARFRQQVLRDRGEQIAVDGLVGPASLAAATRQGFTRWRDVA